MPKNARKPRDRGPDRGRPPALFHHGTDEEVDNRGNDATLGGPGAFDVGKNPSRWSLIPGSSAGGSINRAPLRHSGSGDRKNLGGPGRL